MYAILKFSLEQFIAIGDLRGAGEFWFADGKGFQIMMAMVWVPKDIDDPFGHSIYTILSFVYNDYSHVVGLIDTVD